ncbi:MAG: zinc ribbon domain-containing protein [Bacteroidota bacterium]
MADFLDKVKQGIDKGVNVVSVRSKEALETARLKARIGSLADRKREALEELGGIMYALYQGNPAGVCGEAKGKCEELASLDAQIREMEEALKEVHREANRDLGIPSCAACGEELAEEDKFCRKCGRKVEA